jgi:heptosyltransferase-2
MKIGIIQTAFIGDVVLTTVLIETLRKIYPESFFYFITTKAGSEILSYTPNLKTFVIDKKKGFSELKNCAVALEKEVDELDFLFTVHRSLRSMVLARMIKAKQKIAFRNFFSALFGFKTTSYPPYHDEIHYVDKVLELLKVLDVQKSEFIRKPKLYTSYDETIKLQFKLGSFPQKKYIVCAPFSNWGTKMWPKERFAESLIRIYQNTKYKIFLTGSNSKDEVEASKWMEKKLLNYSCNVQNLVGNTTLEELKILIKDAALVLSNDSAAVHIAASFDVPSVAIFGPTVKKLGFFPLSTKSVVVENKDIKCRPCSLHGPQKCPKKHFQCMLSIDVDTVVKKVLELT